MTIRLFDKYCGRYDKWYDDNKYAYLSEIKALKKVIPQKGVGLEVGVGTGRFAVPLRIKYGIDPSKEMAGIAARRGVDVNSFYVMGK